MTRNTPRVAVLALLLAILGVLGYKLWPRAPGGDVTLAVSACDPGLQACTAAIPGGGQVELAIGPRPIRPLHALDLRVKLSGLAARQVELDFAGSDMQMGYNRPLLAGADGRFAGQTTLPVCVSGNMAWVVTVLLATEDRKVAIPFRFTVSGQ